jgi:Asp-tRNA(Asn)/Glu-tRNA(Gln) amidotransferase A subunit family amidase
LAGIDRRNLLAALGTLAGGAAVAPARGAVSTDLIAACDRFAGLDFTPAERAQMATAVDDQLDRLRRLRGVALENDLAPAETFNPRLPGWTPRAPLPPARGVRGKPPHPGTAEDIAFASASLQGGWIAAGMLTSRALVELYLDRIAARSGRLECFVTVLADQARAEADARDRETRAGRSRGPLHGVPYALKDLFDTAGITTGWGAEPFRDRIPTTDAAVVRRLRDAGAVLLGKTSLGALAYGDIWYGGRTRNPWNPEEGSSGSSAGSAAAVADGLCGFAIGTETMGSIVAPAARCGTVGLRPTFGRVPRTGAMALCWSLDKVGVLARGAEDTGAVLAALNGGDGVDPAAIDQPFVPAAPVHPEANTLGYRPEWFAGGPPTDAAALAAARTAGFRLVEVDPPATDPDLLDAIVVVDSAAAFEALTLDGRDDTLTWKAEVAWPNTWRAARFEPAIGYVQAQRLRRRLMAEFARTMAGVDAILHPTAKLLGIGNHTGYPALVLPAGFVDQPTRTGFASYVAPDAIAAGTPRHRVPFGIALTGHLFDEARLLAIGQALAPHLPPIGRPPTG